MQQIKAAVLCRRMKTIQALTAASNHSRRIDANSTIRVRPDAKKGQGLSWTVLPKSDPNAPRGFDESRDVVAAYKAHKALHGVKTDTGDLGAHLILSVSAAWVAEVGGMHDRDNARNRLLIAEGIRWAEAAFGTKSVYHARLDLDEQGGGVVDVFVAPVRIDGRSKKPRISMNKALHEIQARHGRRKSYEALQDSWADWCQAKLAPSIQRGTSKIITKAEHLEVEEYKEARRLAQVKIDQELAHAAAAAETIRQQANDKAAEVELQRLLVAEELDRIAVLREALTATIERAKQLFMALFRIGLSVQERHEAALVAKELEEVALITEEAPAFEPHP